MISVYRIVTLNKGLSRKRTTEHAATVSLATPRALDASPPEGYSQQYVAGTHLIYTPGWRETMWSTVSCLRKQHNGRDRALNHRPSDLKF